MWRFLFFACPDTIACQFLCSCWMKKKGPVTSRAWASRVTEASKEGRTYKDKGEPMGTAPDRLAVTAIDCVISWKSWSLTFLNSRHLCLMLPLSLDLACACHYWILTDLLVACCMSGRLFSPWPVLPLDIPVWWWHFLLICACHLWFLTASFLLTAQEPGTWHTLLFWQIPFPTLFTPPLSSLLFPFCFLHSSVPYSLHFPTLFNYLLPITSLLSWHLYSLHISTHFTSLISSYVYFLHISTLFTLPQDILCDFKHLNLTWQNLGSSHPNAKCKPGSPNTMEKRMQSFKDHLRAALTMGTARAQHKRKPHPSHTRGSPHRRREPLCARTRRVVVRFLTSKHHLETAVPLRSAISAMQITLQPRRPPSLLFNFTSGLSHISTPYALHLQSLHIPIPSISNLSSSLLSPSLISPHPCPHHL